LISTFFPTKDQFQKQFPPFFQQKIISYQKYVDQLLIDSRLEQWNTRMKGAQIYSTHDNISVRSEYGQYNDNISGGNENEHKNLKSVNFGAVSYRSHSRNSSSLSGHDFLDHIPDSKQLFNFDGKFGVKPMVINGGIDPDDIHKVDNGLGDGRPGGQNNYDFNQNGNNFNQNDNNNHNRRNDRIHNIAHNHINTSTIAHRKRRAVNAPHSTPKPHPTILIDNIDTVSLLFAKHPAIFQAENENIAQNGKGSNIGQNNGKENSNFGRNNHNNNITKLTNRNDTQFLSFLNSPLFIAHTRQAKSSIPMFDLKTKTLPN
jgi:hypothetical protein